MRTSEMRVEAVQVMNARHTPPESCSGASLDDRGPIDRTKAVPVHVSWMVRGVGTGVGGGVGGGVGTGVGGGVGGAAATRTLSWSQATRHVTVI